MRYRDFKFVIVEWEDAFGVVQEWENVGEARRDTPLRCWSSGWLIFSDPKCITVTPHKSFRPDGSMVVCGGMTIPRSAVRKVRILSTGKKLKSW